MNDNSIRIFISGDFAPRYRVNESIEKGEYAQLYGDILPVIQDADYAITNLEAPLIENGTPIAKTGPNIKAPIKSIEALKFAGFDMVTLANNHIMDYATEGLFSTIDICEKNNIAHIGAGKNLKDASKVKYVTIKGKIIAFINVTENEWSTTNGSHPGANPVNEISIYYQIQEAKQNSDYIILIIHGGHETYELPSLRMKKMYRWFVDLGVDAVVGHHTHCFSGDEIYKGKPIIYSLGNFIFDHQSNCNSSWNEGVVVTLTIAENDIDYKLHPFYQCNENVGITLFSEIKVNEFEVSRKEKTMAIQSDDNLEKEFLSFVQKRSKLYMTYLEPIKNKYLLFLINRGVLPRFVKGAYKHLLLNIIRTEAHRDIILKLLTK